MNEDLKSSLLYKKLLPSKFGFASTGMWIVFLILMGLLIGFCGGSACVGAYEDEGETSALLLGVIFAVLYGAMVAVGIRSIKKRKERDYGNARRLEQFDRVILDRLEGHISVAPMRYKTLYLLDGYMYVPKAKLLIRYCDIRELKTVLHSTNGTNDGMRFELVDNYGCKYYIRIKQWKQFYLERPMFLAELEERTKAAYQI